MRPSDHKIYRTFEEFEREELRRVESVNASVDDISDPMFNGELDFEAPAGRRRPGRSWENEDEE